VPSLPIFIASLVCFGIGAVLGFYILELRPMGLVAFAAGAAPSVISKNESWNHLVVPAMILAFPVFVVCLWSKWKVRGAKPGGEAVRGEEQLDR